MGTLIGDLIFATQRQAIFVLLQKNEFGYEVFKCVSGSTFPNSVTYLSTLRNNVSFHDAKVIASFTLCRSSFELGLAFRQCQKIIYMDF